MQTTMENILIIRSLRLDQEIDEQQTSIVKEEKYYRICLTIKDVNDDIHEFHSRKLNLNDAIFERDQLII